MSAVRWTPEQLQAHEARLKGKPTPAQRGTASKPSAPQQVAAPAQTGKRKLQALGRMKDGAMNVSETKYAAHLSAEKVAGRVAWFAFEAVKLKLAPNTHLTIDFFVMYADGRLEAHDVKGAKAIVEDDAKAKAKIAADMFPWPFKFVYPRKVKDGGGWEVEEL